MDKLPSELCRAIIEQIDGPTLKNLRLVSKPWAVLGEEYLISPEFTTLPHRPDSARLKSLSEHPKFSYRIQEIYFNHAEVNEYHARHNTYYTLYMRDPETRTIESTSGWHAYYQIKADKDLHLPESCNKDFLQDVFKCLPNLRSISVTLMTCPFEEKHPELLKSLWAMPSTRHLPRVATTERFTNILLAVASNVSMISLKSLSHDRIPFEFFTQKQTLMSQFSTVFESLTTLDLAMDYSDMPNNLHVEEAFDGLSSLLRSTTSLQSLSVSFQAQRKIDITLLLESLKSNNYVFHALKHFTLTGVITTERDLSYFLLGHKSSLTNVRLGGPGIKYRYSKPNGGVHLSSGSFKGLFERLNEMKLDKHGLLLLGDIVGIESREKWVLEEPVEQERLWEYVMD